MRGEQRQESSFSVPLASKLSSGKSESGWQVLCWTVTVTHPYLSFFLAAEAMKDDTEWTLQRLKTPVSLFQLCQFHVLKNPPKPFGNHSLNSATGISDTMECNSTLFKSSHHSLLTVSQGCCYDLQHSPLKQAATGIHIFFRVSLNFLVMFCATSKITFETHLSDL